MSGISINPYSNLYEQTATSAQNASASRLNDTISGDLSSASDEELMDVCKDFEAYFVEQVMKEMKKRRTTPTLPFWLQSISLSHLRTVTDMVKVSQDFPIC